MCGSRTARPGIKYGQAPRRICAALVRLARSAACPEPVEGPEWRTATVQTFLKFETDPISRRSVPKLIQNLNLDDSLEIHTYHSFFPFTLNRFTSRKHPLEDNLRVPRGI